MPNHLSVGTVALILYSALWHYPQVLKGKMPLLKILWPSQNICSLWNHIQIYFMYRGSPPYADFGTWKPKIVVVGCAVVKPCKWGISCTLCLICPFPIVYLWFCICWAYEVNILSENEKHLDLSFYALLNSFTLTILTNAILGNCIINLIQLFFFLSCSGLICRTWAGYPAHTG